MTLSHAPDLTLIEALETCRSWFERWSPVAETILTRDGKKMFARHPMLLMLDDVLAPKTGKRPPPSLQPERTLTNDQT